MHTPAPNSQPHDPDADVTACYDLDDTQAHVARLLGHDVRHGHARLTTTERRRIGGVMAWAEGVASGLSVDLRAEQGLSGVPTYPINVEGNSGRFRESA